MVFYASKKVSYSIIFFLNFLTGIEYAVILPTALQYLQKFNGNQLDLGFCLSAYSFSSLFSSPIMGKWSDINKNTKLIMIIANLFQIAGSLMYFFGISKTFIICGRLVAGVGLGIIGCLFSDIVKTTSLKERSSVLSRIMVGRQIGMIIGPAFNFMFVNLDYKIGPFPLDKLTAPGLFMAAVWVLLEIVCILFYKNLNEFDEMTSTQSINNVDRERVGDYETFNSNQTNSHANESVSEIDERTSLINSNRAVKRTDENLRIVDNSQTGPLIVRLYNDYIKEEVVAVLAATFTVFFMQTALETLLTPYTRDYFGWTDLGNSVLFAAAGLEIMIVFLALSFISKKISDRMLLLIGLIGNLATLIFLIIYLPNTTPNKPKVELKEYFLFMVPVFGNVFSLPLIVLSSISLLSKLTSSESQGLTQGLRRTVVGIACILGPDWSGAFYQKWYILIGSLIALLVLSLIMTILSFKHLKISNNSSSQQQQSAQLSQNTDSNS